MMVNAERAAAKAAEKGAENVMKKAEMVAEKERVADKEVKGAAERTAARLCVADVLVASNGGIRGN